MSSDNWSALLQMPIVHGVGTSWMLRGPTVSKPRATAEGDRQRAISDAYREYYLRTPHAIAFKTVAELDDWLRKAGREPVQYQRKEEYDKHRATMAFAELVPHLIRPDRGPTASPARTTPPTPKPYSPYSGKGYPDIYGYRVAKPYKGRAGEAARSPPDGRARVSGAFQESTRATQHSRASDSRSFSASDSTSSIYQERGTNGGVPITPESLRQSVEGGKFTAKANELSASMTKASAQLHEVEQYNKRWLGVDHLAQDKSAQHDTIRAAFERQQREILSEEMPRLQAIEQLKDELRDEVRRNLEIELGDSMRQELQVTLMKEKTALIESLRIELREKVAQDLRDEMKEKVAQDLRDEMREVVTQDLRDEMRESVRQELEVIFRREEEDRRIEMREKVVQDLRAEMTESVRQELEVVFRREEEDRRKRLAEDARSQNLKDEPTQTVDLERSESIPPTFNAGTPNANFDTHKRKRSETDEEGDSLTEDTNESFKRRRTSTSAEDHSLMEGVELAKAHTSEEPAQELGDKPLTNGDDGAYLGATEDLYPKLPGEDEDKAVTQRIEGPVQDDGSPQTTKESLSPRVILENYPKLPGEYEDQAVAQNTAEPAHANKDLEPIDYSGYPKLPRDDEDKAVAQSTEEPVYGDESVRPMDGRESSQVPHEDTDVQESEEFQESKPYNIPSEVVEDHENADIQESRESNAYNTSLDVVEETPIAVQTAEIEEAAVAAQAAERVSSHSTPMVQATQPEPKNPAAADSNEVDIIDDTQAQVNPIESGMDIHETQPDSDKGGEMGIENADAMNSVEMTDAQNHAEPVAFEECTDRQGSIVNGNDVVENMDVKADDADLVEEGGFGSPPYNSVEEPEENQASEAGVEEGTEQIREEGRWVGRLGQGGEYETVESGAVPFDAMDIREGPKEYSEADDDDDDSLDDSDSDDEDEEEEEDNYPEDLVYYNNGKGVVYEGYSDDYLEVEEEEVEEDEEQEQPAQYHQPPQQQPKGEPVVIDLCDSDDDDDRPAAPTAEREDQADAEQDEQAEVEEEEAENPNGDGYDADDGSPTSNSSSGSEDGSSSMDDNEENLAPTEAEERMNRFHRANRSETPSTHLVATVYADNNDLNQVERVEEIMEEHFHQQAVVFDETKNPSSGLGASETPNQLLTAATTYFAQRSEQITFLPYTSTAGHQISSAFKQRSRHEYGDEDDGHNQNEDEQHPGDEYGDEDDDQSGSEDEQQPEDEYEDENEDQNGNEDEQPEELLHSTEQAEEQVDVAATADEDHHVDEEIIDDEHKQSVRLEDLGSSFIKPATGLNNEEISKRLGMEGIEPAFSPGRARAPSAVEGVDVTGSEEAGVEDGIVERDQEEHDDSRGGQVEAVSEQAV